MFVVPGLVAVLPEGLPAASLSVGVLGVRVHPQPGPALLASWVYPKELDSFLRLHKMLNIKKETFHAFGWMVLLPGYWAGENKHVRTQYPEIMGSG